MRFNLLIAVSFFFSLAVGLVVPSDAIYAREGLEDDSAALAARGLGGLLKGAKKVAGAFKPKYHVKAGGGKPSQSYSRKEVKKAVKDARTEHSRISAPGTSNRQKKLSPLKNFNNNKHFKPKKLGSKKSFPLWKPKGKGKEFPLPNKHGAGKGPARVILKENKKGKLKLKGVVSHDQKRPHGSHGANDHFRVRPKINPLRRH